MHAGPAAGQDNTSRPEMLERLINWFTSRDEEDEPAGRASTLNRSGAFNVPRARDKKPLAAGRPAAPKPPATGEVRIKVGLDGEIADLGPGKNVLLRDKARPEDSGTHETLSVVDDSPVQMSEETGIDPYNTGKFDRSRNWDKRFR